MARHTHSCRGDEAAALSGLPDLETPTPEVMIAAGINDAKVTPVNAAITMTATADSALALRLAQLGATDETSMDSVGLMTSSARDESGAEKTLANRAKTAVSKGHTERAGISRPKMPNSISRPSLWHNS